MALFENFPYTDMHNLNLDWIIKIAKDFLDQYTHIQQLIADGEQSLQDLTTEGLQQLDEKATNLEALLQAWYDTHSQDIANQLAGALADLNEWYNTHENYLDETLAANITLFNQRAEEKAEQTLESIPDDYTELSDKVNEIKTLVESKLSILDYGVQLINPLDANYHDGKQWNANGQLITNADAIAFMMEVNAGDRYVGNILAANSFVYNQNTAPQLVTVPHYVVFNETTLAEIYIPAEMTNLLVTCAKSALTNPILFREYNQYFYKPTNLFVDYGKHVIEYPTQQKYLGYKYYSFGDSITAYNLLDYIPGTKIEGSLCLGYQHYIVIKTGMALTNRGISGADSNAILTAVLNNNFSDVYMVTIMTGVNDFGRSVDIATYKSNLGRMAQKILGDNPSCRIFFLSNTYGEFYDDHGNIDNSYVNAMKEVAEAYGIPFIDNYHNNGFCPQTVNRYMADGANVTYKIHPNNNGMAIIGTQCANAILEKL